VKKHLRETVGALSAINMLGRRVELLREKAAIDSQWSKSAGDEKISLRRQLIDRVHIAEYELQLIDDRLAKLQKRR